MTQGSFIKPDLVKDIKGRLKFVSTPLHVHQDKIQPPGEPNFDIPITDGDRVALDLFGVDAIEYGIIMNRVAELGVVNEMIATKLKEVITLTKLVDETVLSQRLRNHRQTIARQKEMAVKRDRVYQGKLRAADGRRESIAKSWNEVCDQVRNRWKKILKGLAEALRREEFYVNLHHHDRFVLDYLAKNTDWVIISGGRVVKFDVELLTQIEIEHINNVIEHCVAVQAAEFAAINSSPELHV